MEVSAAFQRVNSSKDQLRELLGKALYELGLHEDLEIASITFRMRRMPVQCPAGQVPVWETTTKPDGTIVSEWVCRQDA